jgi:hypothetical protein
MEFWINTDKNVHRRERRERRKKMGESDGEQSRISEFSFSVLFFSAFIAFSAVNILLQFNPFFPDQFCSSGQANK